MLAVNKIRRGLELLFMNFLFLKKNLIIFGIIIILAIFLGTIVIKNFQQNLEKFQKMDKGEFIKEKFYKK